MTLRILCLLIFAIIPAFTYRAAVVQYSPLFPNPGINTKAQAQSLMLHNLDNYEAFLKTAKFNFSAELIVLPEDGLYGDQFDTRDEVFPFLEDIPDPNPNVVACNNQSFADRPVFTRLSCYAQKYAVVLVADMGDVKKCSSSPCPSDGRFQYNTAVAFAPTGALLARYHKSHLYGETQFNQPPIPDPVYFDALGVRFGLMICYDLTFSRPASDYVKMGIKNIIHPTWWENSLPAMNAVMAQQAFSFAYQVNLLSANSGHSAKQSGQGIYSRGEYLVYHSDPVKRNDDWLLVADVDPNASNELREVGSVAVSVPIKSLPFAHSKRLKVLSENGEVEENEDMRNEFGVFPRIEMKTFMATAGSSGNQSISVTDGGNQFNCFMSYSVSANQPEGWKAEQYGLGLAILGPMAFCSLVVCPIKDICLLSGNHQARTVFDSFTVVGKFPSFAHLYVVAATDGGQLTLPGSIDRGVNFISSKNVFNQTLLSAGVMARLNQ